MNNDDNKLQPAWAQLLKDATKVPGMISQAFRAFHHYSIGNQVLAMFQCMARGLMVGPIDTYMGWKAKGRQVRKGEKALVLCMPITRKIKAKADEDEDKVFTQFIFRPNWFVLSQTDGDDIVPEPIPGWDKAKALQCLELQEVPFAMADGNCLGYARRKEVAVNPLAQNHFKVLFHEMAHILLGHTKEGEMVDSADISHNLCEAEAEAVALLLGGTLGLPGEEVSRGYIQSWYGKSDIPEKSAQRIFKVADQILKAGQ